jgi:hypothetical protein
MPLMAIRADDFRCTESGFITEIHIWGSFEKDELPAVGPGGLIFTLSIWSDIPAHTPGTPGYNWSIPGTQLWTKVFLPGTYDVIEVSDDSPEGWFDPELPEYVANDHIVLYQYNFDIPVAEAYEQEENNIYWLGVQHYVTLPGRFGWKSTDPTLQWNDNAVRQTGAGWLPLEYPTDHLFAGQPLDLAFVINGTSVPTLTTPPWSFTPKTLNLASKGKWVMIRGMAPEGYDASDIDINTVMLECPFPLCGGQIPAAWGKVTGNELMLKFDRSDLEDMILGSGSDVKPAEFKLTGQLSDGSQFKTRTDTITFTGLE